MQIHVFQNQSCNVTFENVLRFCFINTFTIAEESFKSFPFPTFFFLKLINTLLSAPLKYTTETQVTVKHEALGFLSTDLLVKSSKATKLHKCTYSYVIAKNGDILQVIAMCLLLPSLPICSTFRPVLELSKCLVVLLVVGWLVFWTGNYVGAQ